VELDKGLPARERRILFNSARLCEVHKMLRARSPSKKSSQRENDMDLGLKDRVALVAASSQGLGKACALELAREGARVVICARGRRLFGGGRGRDQRCDRR